MLKRLLLFSALATLLSTSVQAQLCRNTDTKRCLLNGLYQAEVTWVTPLGQNGVGRVAAQVDKSGNLMRDSAGQPIVMGTEDTGIFWFFNRSNLELFLKVLDGCGINNKVWIFSGGLTNVDYDLKVTYMPTGESKIYRHRGGQAVCTTTDTLAFEGPAVCPVPQPSSQDDTDDDGVSDSSDNCPVLPNPTQADGDGDKVGNSCDNCPQHANADQADSDSDGTGDACELAPTLPATSGLTASPVKINAGQSSTLSWFTQNSTAASISPGVGSVPLSGSVVVTPTATTTYTLTVEGAPGTAPQTSSATVEVTPVPQPRCTLALSVDLIGQGSPVKLTWTTQNAVSARLDPLAIDVNLNGSLTVNPLTSTLFRLTVNGGPGTVPAVCTAEVEVLPPLTITINASATVVRIGANVDLSVNVQNAAPGPLLYRWEVLGPLGTILNTGLLNNLSVLFALPGLHNVRLQVTDSLGRIAVAQVNVQVSLL